VTEGPDPSLFLSGESGTVAGVRLGVTRRVADAALGAAGALTFTGPRLDRLAARQEPRSVLVLSVYRPRSMLVDALPRLSSRRHRVHHAFGSTGPLEPALAAHTVATEMKGGKFENLNALLAAAPPLDYFDWVLVVDDDVGLPPRLVDRFVALCETLGLDLAQPAQTRRSHAAWRVTRRRAFSLARRTPYVEIGPVTGFRAGVASELMPFPPLRFGWGLDNHWGALARERGWRLGVIDCLPVRHESQRVASAYAHADAKVEARAFLRDRPYVPTAEAQRTLSTIRRLPSGGRSASPGGGHGARLKVLVVPKWYPWPEEPVLGQFCREHARALATRHDVVVLASRAMRSPGFAAFAVTDEVEDELRTIRVRYRRPRVRAPAMVCQLAGMLVALARLRREGLRPDVVHAHVFSAGLPALLLGRLSGAPVVVTEHYTGFARGLVRGADLLTARLAFTGADLVAPVSAELAEHLRRVAPRARMKVLPNTVDTDTFHPPSGERANGRSRLVNVGALAEKKGQGYLLEALERLRRERDDVELDLVGGGELRERLETQAERLGLAEVVRFHGETPKEEVAELMRRADLFVLPSLHENLPCVLIEAMATGLPSVATRVGGVPELIDERAGVLVGSGDSAALAGGIREALDRDFDPLQIARRARERYSYEAVARQWTEVYEELPSRRGRTSSATRRRRASSR